MYKYIKLARFSHRLLNDQCVILVYIFFWYTAKVRREKGDQRTVKWKVCNLASDKKDVHHVGRTRAFIMHIVGSMHDKSSARDKIRHV